MDNSRQECVTAHLTIAVQTCQGRPGQGWSHILLRVCETGTETSGDWARLGGRGLSRRLKLHIACSLGREDSVSGLSQYLTQHSQEMDQASAEVTQKCRFSEETSLNTPGSILQAVSAASSVSGSCANMAGCKYANMAGCAI